MLFEYVLNLYWSDLLERFINNDEGGWVLTNYKNDPGGMTYGGMTFNTFQEGMKKYNETVSPEGFCAAASTEAGMDQQTNLRLRIKQVYFDLFIAPFLNGNSEGIPCQAMVLSCAVNVGVNPCVQIMQRVINKELPDEKVKVDGVFGRQTRARWTLAYQMMGSTHLCQAFVNMWIEHYARMVQANASVWVQYALTLESKVPVAFLPKSRPQINRAESLIGWMNRAKRYA